MNRRARHDLLWKSPLTISICLVALFLWLPAGCLALENNPADDSSDDEVFSEIDTSFDPPQDSTIPDFDGPTDSSAQAPSLPPIRCVAHQEGAENFSCTLDRLILLHPSTGPPRACFLSAMT